MNVANLWGDLKLDQPIRTPAAILQEQCEALRKLTTELVSGEVDIETESSSETDMPKFVVKLHIVAQLSDSYRLNLLNIKHRLDSYPATVISDYDAYGRKRIPCANEAELLEAIGDILGSEPVKRIIRSLIAQGGAIPNPASQTPEEDYPDQTEAYEEPAEADEAQTDTPEEEHSEQNDEWS